MEGDAGRYCTAFRFSFSHSIQPVARLSLTRPIRLLSAAGEFPTHSPLGLCPTDRPGKEVSHIIISDMQIGLASLIIGIHG